AELDMARQLVDTLTGDFDASRYHDEYRKALLKVIDAKVAGQPVEAAAPEVETSKLTDLMAVLEASVAAAREELFEADDDATVPAATAAAPVSVDSARKAVDSARKAKAAKTKSKSAKISSKAKATPSKSAKSSKAKTSASKSATSTAARRRKTA
ncbi:MAG: hypothetical protein ACC726_16135, partial [Chloroflexota bacterium]